MCTAVVDTVKTACWCETNDERTNPIADAEARIKFSTASIDVFTATSARLHTNQNLEQDVAKNQAALDKVAAIRQKRLAEFNAEEEETFEPNLASSRKEEGDCQEAYEGLKAAKELQGIRKLKRRRSSSPTRTRRTHRRSKRSWSRKSR